MNAVDQRLSEFFSENGPIDGSLSAVRCDNTFSSIFFSDIRKDTTDLQKYAFVRELVEFADQSGFESVCFPERHFYEFGSIYANSSVMAAYFAPLTRHVRLRAASVSCPLHHPAAIVENWAMVDNLSNGRVDLGFGSGWNKADFVLSPDAYENRSTIRDEMIPIIQKLWRGEVVNFRGPDGAYYPTRVYPRPIQKELNVWYSTFSDHGFAHAGKMGYNVLTMLLAIDFSALEKKISIYRKARSEAGLNPSTGMVSLLIHTFVHPDLEWVQRVVERPLKEYIRSSIIPQMKALERHFDATETEKIINYSYSRYFHTSGIFGPVNLAKQQVERAIRSGVNDIAFLQDFGVDYSAVKSSLPHLKELVELCRSTDRRRKVS